MSNIDEKMLERILRELQDIKVILQDHCNEEHIKILDKQLNKDN